MLREPIIPIPAKWQRSYQLWRAVLYLVFLALGILFALKVLFPTLHFGFDFRTPHSSRNTIQAPQAPNGILRENGKIEGGGTLLAYASPPGNYGTTHVNTVLEKDSELPERFTATVQRSYRSFFLPTGEPLTTFPSETLYLHDGTYYALREGTLFPFVSPTAFATRFPERLATPAPPDLLERYPVSESWLGFRVGSLVSFANGVFVIVSETEMRPIGSAEIFLSLGYRFEDVIGGSEEELGIYERGRILLLGAEHPEGTLLYDQDSDTAYLIMGQQRRPVTGEYLEFLRSQQTPIAVSGKASQEKTSCDLTPSLFGRTYSCTLDATRLTNAFGPDFRLSLMPERDIDINRLSVAFETTKSQENLLTLLSQIKQRFLNRFGYGAP